MSKAPEQIWAEPGMPGYLDEPHELYTVQYTRTDVVDRIVQEAVKVKPLVWINRPNDPQGYTWKARKPFGSAYYLHEKDGLHSWGGDYVPLEEAKAAAQADYEARILSALKGGEQ